MFIPTRVGAEWGPGIFSATLHRVRMFPFVLDHQPRFLRAGSAGIVCLQDPTVTIAHTDAPVDVTLFDAGRAEIQSWSKVRTVAVVPPAPSTSYLRVVGDSVTRYTISANLKYDRDAVPGPFQEELEIVPKWWGDPPPYRIFDREKYFAVTVATTVPMMTSSRSSARTRPSPWSCWRSTARPSEKRSRARTRSASERQGCAGELRPPGFPGRRCRAGAGPDRTASSTADVGVIPTQGAPGHMACPRPPDFSDRPPARRPTHHGCPAVASSRSG